MLKCDSIKVQCYKWTPVNYCGEEVLRRIKNIVALIKEFKPWDGKEWANVNNLKKAIIQAAFILPGTDHPHSVTAPCMSCSVNVDLDTAEFIPSYMATKLPYPTKGPHIILVEHTYALYICCGDIQCYESKNFVKFVKEVRLFFPVETMEGKDHCDWCHEWTNSPHRCSSCKCKIYCSASCQFKDWKIHQKVCNIYKSIGHKNVVTKDKTMILYGDSGDPVWSQDCNQNRLRK